MKRLIALLAAVVVIAASVSCINTSKADVVNDVHGKISYYYEILLDNLIEEYDRYEYDSVAFAMLLDYYYNGYIMSKKLDATYEMMMLDLKVGAGSSNEAMQKVLENELTQRKTTNMIYESLVNGDVDAKKYIEGIRYAYEASKAK